MYHILYFVLPAGQEAAEASTGAAMRAACPRVALSSSIPGTGAADGEVTSPVRSLPHRQAPHQQNTGQDARSAEATRGGQGTRLRVYRRMRSGYKVLEPQSPYQTYSRK